MSKSEHVVHVDWSFWTVCNSILRNIYHHILHSVVMACVNTSVVCLSE